MIAFTQMDAQPEPEPKLPVEPAAEMIAIDAASATTTPSRQSEDTVSESFSLDPDANPPVPASPPPIARPHSPPPPVHVGSADFFSLDLDAQSTPGHAMAARVDLPAAAKAANVELPPPVTETMEEPITLTKPAKNGRPEIKITMLRPGQKSPLQ